MGIYADQVLPRIVNTCCGMKSNGPLRERVCVGLHGPVDPPSRRQLCDTAVSTWTMCTIPDVARVLQEVRRVLKPGGTLHFVEHGLAPDEKVQRVQHRLEPMQKRVFGGCHLTRQIVDLVTDAGFTISEADVFYDKGAPKLLAAQTLGVAVA